MPRAIQIFAVGLGLLLTGCPHTGRVLAFSAEPPLTCAGKPVLIKWAVQGHAALRADPAPPNWNEQMPSSGELSVPLTTTTTFTLQALDANLAKGNSSGNQRVQINPHNQKLGNSAPCDAATRSCSGSFSLQSGGTLQAVQLANPSFFRLGTETPHDVCVTPPNGQKTCVAAGQTVNLASPADGTWKIEAELGASDAVTPPPQLRVEFDFGCP
jgi:hypothetical protein